MGAVAEVQPEHVDAGLEQRADRVAARCSPGRAWRRSWPVADVASSILASIARWRIARVDQDGAEVIDVGPGRAGDDRSPSAAKKPPLSLARQRVARRRCPAARPRARRVGCERSRRPLSSMPSMPSVSQARAWMPAQAVERDGERQQELALRPPRPPVAAHGHRGLAARQHARRRRGAGWPCGATCARDARHGPAPTSRASPSIVSPRMTGASAARRAHARPRPAALLRACAMMSTVRPREARVAGLRRLARRRRPGARATAAGGVDARTRSRIARASAKRRRVGHRRAGARSPPGRRPARRRSPGVTTRAGCGGGREPAALDRREVLAHAVHLVDRRAASAAAPC